MNAYLRRADGFTLVELLVVILIMGVVGGYTVRSLVSGYQTTSSVQERLDTHAELQNVQIAVTRQLRAACPVLDIGPYDTTVMVRHSDGTVEEIQFELPAGGVLYEHRREWDGSNWGAVTTRPIADGLENLTEAEPVFTAYDSDGNLASTRFDVGSFETRLLRSAVDGDPMLVTTTVALRNGDIECPTAP